MTPKHLILTADDATESDPSETYQTPKDSTNSYDILFEQSLSWTAVSVQLFTHSLLQQCCYDMKLTSVEVM
jgi:hypothetical protein